MVIFKKKKIIFVRKLKMKLRKGCLQKIREEYKLKIEDLANLLDITHQEYEQIEKGNVLDFEKVQKISDFFDIPLSEFLPEGTHFYNYNSGPIGVNLGTYNHYHTNEELIKYLLEENQRLSERLKSLENFIEAHMIPIPKGGATFPYRESEEEQNKDSKD